MIKPIRVGLVQINNSFSNQNYFPYSVGILQAYAMKHLKDKDCFEFKIPIYKRVDVDEAVTHLKGSNIVFFSTYTWNINISLEIASRMKLQCNDTIVVFGGPQVPLNGIYDFLKQYRFIDIACHGEGEKASLGILENTISKLSTKHSEWKDIPNISYLDTNGGLIQTRLGIRITDLKEIPSPYTDGIFTTLMKANPSENWVGLFETNRGCPFSCSYCVWGAYENKKVYARDINDIFKEIDWFSVNKVEFIFCCDANFGILPRDLQIAEYMSMNKNKFGYPKALSCQNTKNSTMQIYNIYKTLSDVGLSKGVSLSIQSTNQTTLKNIKRKNISISVFQELQNKFNKESIETFTDIILGLPCETYSSFADGVSKVISNGQHNRIQFNNLSILTGSEMDDELYKKKYDIVTVKSRLVNVHGSLIEKNKIDEYQNIVVETKAMPREDWIKARIFSWMVALLHFDKLTQIPFILLNRKCSISYREMIEKIIEHSREYTVLNEIVLFFEDQAKSIQKGWPEYTESRQWLDIWWPPDEYMMINICANNKLEAFYSDMESLLIKYILGDVSADIIDELKSAMLLNKKLVKLPNKSEDIILKFQYNIWDFYRFALENKEYILEKGSFKNKIDRTSCKWNSWEDWCREVIWYGNKRGAYLYQCTTVK